jgi:SAM-dependent methyltransferase
VSRTDTIERSLALLTERPARITAPKGYLDLLGSEEPPAAGIPGHLMRTRLVPLVYERWWRPLVGRAAKGLLGPTMRDEHRIARLLLGLRPGDGVLDVGCGPGNFTREFARVVGPAGLAVGLDASATMLERAVRDTPSGEVAYVRADASRLPFRDASFDAVCCFAALNLVADPFAALDEMARVLTRGGRIALFTTCAVSSPPLRTLTGPPGGVRMFDRDELTTALGERGFAEVHQRVHGITQFVGGRSVRSET